METEREASRDGPISQYSATLPGNGDRIVMLGLIEIFYDGISPVMRWKPF